MRRVVVSFEQAVSNIETYNDSLQAYAKLAARIKQHPAWYAIKDAEGRWRFGPSKFIGYADADAASYLATYDRRNGRETEPALKQWFGEVDPHTALGQELAEAFRAFAAGFGKAPHVNWRVSVPAEYLSGRKAKLAAPELSRRIVFDPAVCGGRPHIRGTRVRVSDIIGAVAEGETVEAILADFPYLSSEDITAALQYAAAAVDHRVLFAA